MPKSGRQKAKLRPLLVIYCLTACPVLILSFAGAFSGIDRAAYDLFLRLKITYSPAPLDPGILRVDLNDSSERELGEGVGSRAAFADVIDVLGQCGSRSMVDFVFRGPAANDGALAEAAARMGAMVLAVVPVPEKLANFAHEDLNGEEREILRKSLWHIRMRGKGDIPAARTFIMSEAAVSASASRLGHIGMEADEDGVYRKVPLFYRWEDGVIPSLALAAAAEELGVDPRGVEFWPGKEVTLPVGGGRPVSIPVDESGFAIIPYTSTWAGSGGWVSFAETAAAKHDGAVFENLFQELGGAITVLADTTTAKKDFGLTPFETVFPLSGVHAALLSGILNEYFYAEMNAPGRLFVFFIFSLLAFGAGLFKKDTPYHAGCLLLLLLFTGLLSGLWHFERFAPWAAAPALWLFAFWACGFAFRLFSRHEEKLRLELTFSRYLSPAVVREIMDNPEKLGLGGEKKVLTALFTDIQGFSAISEELGDPRRIVELLNFYLSGMSGIILDNRGTIDKYEGDAIVAFFGAPLESASHAFDACRSAVLMKRREADLNREIIFRGLSPFPLFTRIGVNSGEMVAGNMGTAKKMNYTVMGNAVNLASRIEGVNKQYHTGGIIISEYTKDLAGGGFVYRSLDRVRVVGINAPVRLYELLDLRNDAPESLIAMTAAWETAMAEYERRRFREAAALFNGIVKNNGADRTARLYANRCGRLLESPPEADWDGVFNLTEK